MSDSDLFQQLASSDYFFHYSEFGVDDVCKHDLAEIIIQPQRSFYFLRNWGAGIKNYEGNPIGLLMQIMIPFNIANSVALRNTATTDGTNNKLDRRIAVSQNSIDFKIDGMNIDISVGYFLFANSNNRSENKLKLNSGDLV